MRFNRVSQSARRRLFVGTLAAVGFVAAWVALFRQSADPPEVIGAPPSSGKVEPQPLFEKWPQDRKPDLVLLLSGQNYGFLQKCGCSSPQKKASFSPVSP